MDTTSPFELRILQDTAELDDSQRVRTYVQAGLLNVEMVMQTRRTSTRRDEFRIGFGAPTLMRIGQVSPLISNHLTSGRGMEQHHAW